MDEKPARLTVLHTHRAALHLQTGTDIKETDEGLWLVREVGVTS